MTAKEKRKKKTGPPLPQPRHVWKINPRTRIKPSAKIYDRPKKKKQKETWIDHVDWYGDQE